MTANPIIEVFTPGNPEHRQAFADLNREWLTEYFVVEPADEAMFADPEGILAHGGLILFARMEDRLVGTGTLYARGNNVYEIAKMAVTRDYRGKGIGRKIALALIEKARAKGAESLYIASNRKLESALALYRRLGFAEIDGGQDTRYARCDITLEMPLAA